MLYFIKSAAYSHRMLESSMVDKLATVKQTNKYHFIFIFLLHNKINNLSVINLHLHNYIIY